MSGLLGGISNAAKALAAQQAGVQVAGRNLANVNTPGYSRQRVELGDRAVIQTALGSVGTGVEALGTIQIRDQFLDANVSREASTTAALTAEQNALQRGESALGEQVQATDSTTGSSSTGLSSTINDFFNGFDNLAANPTDAGARQVLYQKATLLTDRFNAVDSRLSTVQTDLSSQISADTDSANTVLKQIADLNTQIATAEVSAPGSALELRDQRQQQLEKLSGYLNFTTQTGTNGQLNVLAKDSGGADVTLVQDGRARGALAFNGTNLTIGTSATVLAPTGGSIAGSLSARDGTLQTLRDDLKKAATSLATAVNTAYNPGGAATNFFTVPPPSGVMALDPSLTATSLRTTATGTSGGNEIALAVADVSRKAFSTGSGDPINGTLSNFLATTVSGFGQSMTGVDTKLKDQTLVQTMATAQRDSVSGVSMDEETTDLIKFQRAYEANARVVKTFDEMLDTLVNMVN